MMIARGITRQLTTLTDRLEVDTDLCGGLPKHDDNTVYEGKWRAWREKFQSRKQRDKINKL